MNTAIFYSDTFLNHKAPMGHPENENRLIAIKKALEIVNFFGIPVKEPHPASTDELELVHTKEHIERVRKISSKASYLDPDTYTSTGSFEAALKAAGAVVQAAESIEGGQLSQAFCLVRPPGHHALANQSMGFCLFNNVAVGAAWFVKNCRRKVAILDFDAHHGNGTQSIFYNSDQVLYCSWHQWPHYPGTGASSETGEGKGKGFSINIPLQAGSSDDIFIQSFDELVLPALEQFSPSLIIISAGFDSHKDDPLSALQFTEQGYADFFKRLLKFISHFPVGLIFTLEGGYDLNALSSCVLKSLEVLADKN